MDNQRHINVSLRNARERHKRQREILLACLAVGLIIILTWIELRFLGGNSYLFFALFNFNLVLLILVLFLVLRNVIKLIMERRRKVLGSGLRMRLVIVFVTLSVVPTLIMFLISMRFVHTSVDYWFKARVEASMEQALSVGQDYYAQAKVRVESYGDNILNTIRDRKLAWGGKAMDDLLEAKRQEFGLDLVGVLSSTRTETNWHAKDRWQKRWAESQERIPWDELAVEPKKWSVMWADGDTDMVMAMFPVGGAGFLIIGDRNSNGFMHKLDEVTQGLSEYRELRSLKYPLKLTLYLVLGLMTMVIFLGATWFAFRLAREISAPVQAMALATQRIAKGDLTVRLTDDARDELGLLVQSFNRMAEDLEQSRANLTHMNRQLQDQYQVVQAQNHYVRAILENITAGVVSLDRFGLITTMNQAAEAILGLEAKELVGQSALQLLDPEHRGLVDEVRQLMESSPGSQWQRRVDLEVKGEVVKLLITAVALRDSESDASGIVAVFENISELEKMQRLDAWKEVARRIAHEIKNPLTPIKLSAERLERKFGQSIEDPVFTQCTGLIVKQVEHLQEMVREFSAFAKLPEVHLRLEQIEPLLRETMDVFAGSHAHIRWSMSAESVPLVLLDREAIKRVFLNLLLNAAEVLQDRTDGMVEAVIYGRKRNARVYVEIRDNGPGIRPEEQARMFEPYYSTKRGGTGLGLTIVKSVISDHHGFVRVRPNEPVGTVFVLELPAARSEA